MPRGTPTHRAKHVNVNVPVGQAAEVTIPVQNLNVLVNVCDDAGDKYRYGFNGKEKLNEWSGMGNAVDFGARIYDSRIGRWLSVDPMAEKFPWQTTYSAMDNNPIMKNDPTGAAASTDVKDNKNGTYTVVDAKYNDDRNVYVVDKKGKHTGERIGKTATKYSFLDDKGDPVTGAVIDLNDNSGSSFIEKKILIADPPLGKYISNARNGHAYDFKDFNIDKRTKGMSLDQFRYRGMPFNVVGFEKNIIATARDIGNIGAGIVAGRAGLSWSVARYGFDAYQSRSLKATIHEGMPTQTAERLGWDYGSELLKSTDYNDYKIENADDYFER